MIQLTDSQHRHTLQYIKFTVIQSYNNHKKVTYLTPLHKKKQYMVLALQVLIYPRIFHLFFLHYLSIELNESVFLHHKTLNTKIGSIL